MRVKELGSVSSGTLRNEDLIPAFLEKLKEITGGCPRVEEIEARMEEQGDEYFECDDAFEDLEDLINDLGNYAPPYTFFGTHEGDGADFGFWIAHDSIAEDRQSGELKAGDETPETGERRGTVPSHQRPRQHGTVR